VKRFLERIKEEKEWTFFHRETGEAYMIEEIIEIFDDGVEMIYRDDTDNEYLSFVPFNVISEIYKEISRGEEDDGDE